MIVLVDNYDSFTWNVYQLMRELGADVHVVRNDEVSVAELVGMRPERVVISPGPGTPRDAGISCEVVRVLGCGGDGRAPVPVLGVCLGHQCIGEVFGGTIDRAGELVHGKTSAISHDGTGVFAGLPTPFDAVRYHSLVVVRQSVPAELVVTAESANGLVMGLRHRELPIEGVQFHPESILTMHGRALLANFLHIDTTSSARLEAGAGVKRKESA